MAMMRQMESIPDPPLSLRKIPKERRCSHCKAIATSWAQSLAAKVASLPTRKLREDEYMEALETVCEESKAPSGEDTLQRERQWLCKYLLDTIGEEELWSSFLKFKDIPPDHLCSSEVRLCPRNQKDVFQPRWEETECGAPRPQES